MYNKIKGMEERRGEKKGIIGERKGVILRSVFLSSYQYG